MPAKKKVTDLAKKPVSSKKAGEVKGGTRASKAQSDVSAKYNQAKDAIAQNFK